MSGMPDPAQTTEVSLASIIEMFSLIKRGDPVSLVTLREKLGRSRAELATHMDIVESQLASWEENGQNPTAGQQALWKVKLSDYLNLEIRKVLQTDNTEIIARFWELMWRLS